MGKPSSVFVFYNLVLTDYTFLKKQLINILQDDLDSLVNSPSSFAAKVGPTKTLHWFQASSFFLLWHLLLHKWQKKGETKRNWQVDVTMFFRLETEEPSSPRQTLMQETMLWLWGRPLKDLVQKHKHTHSHQICAAIFVRRLHCGPPYSNPNPRFMSNANLKGLF